TQSVATLEAALARERQHATAQRFLSNAHTERAYTLAKLKRHAEAAAEAKALLRLRRISADGLCNLARIYSLSYSAARDDDPRQAEQYAVQAVGLLRRAIAQGYKDVERLKIDSDYGGIRQRPDFQKLVGDLGKRNGGVKSPDRRSDLKGFS